MTAPSAAATPPELSVGLRPRVLHGIDVVAVERSAQLLERYGAGALRRTATAAEADWIGVAAELGVAAERLGVVLGLKESAIKAMAGRPDGFAWQLIETGVGERSVPSPRPGSLPSGVREVLEGFATGCGLGAVETVGVRLGPAGVDRVRELLGTDGDVRGAGCYGIRDGHVLAATTFWRDGTR